MPRSLAGATLEFRSRARLLGGGIDRFQFRGDSGTLTSDLATKPARQPNEISLRVSPRIHYIEYLVRKIRLTQLEPLPLLNVDDLETCVRRAGRKLPANWYGRDPEQYKNDLVEVNVKGGTACRGHD